MNFEAKSEAKTVDFLRRQQPHLGTFVEVGVGPFARADQALNAAFTQVREVHELLSTKNPTSELSRLNAGLSSGASFHPTTVLALRLAWHMMRKSRGLFSCFEGGEGQLEDLEIRRRHVWLRSGRRLTLDGIAKGMAVDLAVRALRQAGAEQGWVNAGGDLRVFGDLELPIERHGTNGLFLGLLKNGAVATSEVWATPSQRYPGLILTNQGHAPQVGTWTVMAREAWRADALTKVAALAPGEDRANLICGLGGRLLETRLQYS